MSTALASLDFSSYRRLLQALFKDLAGIVVRDAAGNPVYQDEPLCDLPPIAGQVECRVCLGRNAAGEYLGTLTARLDQGVELAAVERALADVAATMARECELVDELNAMADELATRYEELNMVYSTEDQVSDFGQSQAMLQRLVRNYIQFLNIDRCVLLLPEKQICIVEDASGCSLPDAGPMPEVLRTDVLPLLSVGYGPLVFNTAEDVAAVGLAVAFPYKFAVQPIREGGSKVTGLLAIANAPHGSDFTNSDRNLLEVMARKAAKILQAGYDQATGLMQRAGFEHHLRLAMAKVQIFGEPACVLGVDIDRMQVINDTLGRDAGDALISHVGVAIRKQVRDTDTVARLGGDEFGILLGNCRPEQGLRIAEKILRESREPAFVWQGEGVETSLSVGIVPLDDGFETVEQVIGSLDLAFQTAKEKGPGQAHLFWRQDADLISRKEAMYWVGRLQTALRDQQFRLHAQLIAPLGPASRRPHYEILLRMTEPDGRLIQPGAFIPPAERYNLMPAIDRWVFKCTLEELGAYWLAKGELGAVFSLNLSGQSLADPALLEFIVKELLATPFPHDRLCFEITETAAIAKMESARQFIDRVRGMGCSFALDDFGAGLSSYSYLRNLNVDLVKIDGSFVRNILEDPVSDVMVQSVVAIARQMNILTVAEFVENDAIRERLRSVGVDYAQGYGVGKPTPLPDILAALGDGGTPVALAAAYAS